MARPQGKLMLRNPSLSVRALGQLLLRRAHALLKVIAKESQLLQLAESKLPDPQYSQTQKWLAQTIITRLERNQ